MLRTWEIGKKEKHTIVFDYSSMRGLTGDRIVKIDGREVLRKRNPPIEFPTGKTIGTFKVGKKEKHEVELKWTGPEEVTCFVDGMPIMPSFTTKSTGLRTAIALFMLAILILLMILCFQSLQA